MPHLRPRAVIATAFVLSLLSLLTLPSLGSSDWLRRPLNDDAYYFLVVARNVADGQGITFATRDVNGFQPLHLLTCMVAGALSRWSELNTPAVLTGLDWLLLNGVGTWLLLVLGRAARFGSPVITCCALVWLYHPYGQRFAVNGMETSLALVAWLLVGVAVLRRTERPVVDAVVVGVALGLAFLARNDAIVLSVAYGVGRLLAADGRNGEDRGTTVRQLALTAVVVVAVAFPWLWYNVALFGSLIPQSGVAERAGGLYDTGRAAQVLEGLAAFVRNLSPLPFPLARVGDVTRLGLAVALLGMIAFAVRLVWRTEPRVRPLLALYGPAVAMLFVIYIGAFGAPHMLTRWLAPAVVVSTLTFGHILGRLWEGAGVRRPLAVSAIALVITARFVTALADARMPQPTNTWQLLRYVRTQQTGAEARTVGSFQAGLLAWSLPRVENLDGKLNPDALEALRAGQLPEWIAASDIAVIVDQDLYGFEKDPVLLRQFALTSPEPGLLVMQRRPVR